MRSYDVVGYTNDGATYCLSCASYEQGGDYPIFAGDEHPGGCVCDECGEEIIEPYVEEEAEGPASDYYDDLDIYPTVWRNGHE